MVTLSYEFKKAFIPFLVIFYVHAFPDIINKEVKILKHMLLMYCSISDKAKIIPTLLVSFKDVHEPHVSHMFQSFQR